jgi:hypothetical protein
MLYDGRHLRFTPGEKIRTESGEKGTVVGACNPQGTHYKIILGGGREQVVHVQSLESEEENG